jgi:hypothetical protein
MRFNPVPFLVALVLCGHAGLAQVVSTPDNNRYQLVLKSGAFTPEQNVTDSGMARINRKAASRGAGKSLIIIQFESLPTISERQQLLANGIELIEYVPHNAYTATVSGGFDLVLLKKLRTRAIIEPSPSQKMDPSLTGSTFPSRAVKLRGSLDLWVSFPATIPAEKVLAGLRGSGFEIVSTLQLAYRIIEVRIPENRLEELAALPFIEYVQPLPGEEEVINNKSRVNTRANILQSPLPGHYNLSGEGVVVGVGDALEPSQHIDFTGRLINRSANPPHAHGMHVMGTVGSAGLVREDLAGYAPKSTIVAQQFAGILAYTPEYIQDYGMVITNNSYGNSVSDCATFGQYDFNARIMDLQLLQYPNLQHVFAAGNSGAINCGPYLPGFGNVLGGYQSAKNTLQVGSGDITGAIYSTSSKGPVLDGRIKPEITAQGVNVASTIPTNRYGVMTGTSMSSPAVSGGLALLYERYRQLHGGANPKNGLMKALVVNGATDKGNPGPDYSYGFGWLNLLRSVKMLDQANYFNTNVNSGATNTHTLTIPVGHSIAQLKVMLYWNDAAANVMASKTLVNDLDLTVTDPTSATHLPFILNSNPSAVSNNATTGVDNVNNIEQVVIDNPVPGNYTFSVKGTTIPFSSQYEYFLVYDTIPVSTTLTYPAGGERLAASDAIYIQWESYGNTGNDLTIQYSYDDGATWTNVSGGTNVAANLRQLAWSVPAGATDQARVKIIHNGTGLESISERFVVVGLPTVTLASTGSQCEGYININWTAVTGATDYEVMLLRGDEWTSVTTTNLTNHIFRGLSRDTTYWVTVRSRVNGTPGRRATAISRLPLTGNCAGTISDKDLKIDTILLPSSGRKFTSTELTANTPISIRIENLDNAATSGDIPVSYSVNNGTVVTETIVAPVIASRGTLDYTFTTPVDMSALGTYDVQVIVSYPGDPVTKNDTLRTTFKQLDNPLINIATPFLDNIETASPFALTGRQFGLPGLDRYDFSTTTAFGQVRSVINTGMAFSGTKALTLDADRYNAGGTVDSLTGTFNLQGYDAINDEIRLDFMYKHHDQQSHPANKVWIRGTDLDPWIEVFDLYANQGATGVYKKTNSIELSEFLANQSQNFSSSFQVRWGQRGIGIAATNEGAAGYTFDDIQLYRVTNDLQLVSIDTPRVLSCGLGNAVPVRTKIKNTAHTTLINVPVRIQIDANPVLTEFIPSLPANDTADYTFTTLFDFSVPGNHTIKVWVDMPSDSYRLNDTAQVALYNAPVITTFPYLEDFESGDGYWHSGGIRSSWQYGVPAAVKINKAASGTKAWKTSLTGNYNNLEKSYLYSPCLDVSTLTKPMLSFSLAIDMEDCGVDTCDIAYVEYSTDNLTWSRLGAANTGTNWYNRDYANNNAWSIENYTRWHAAAIPLPVGATRLRVRFVIETDPALTREGVAIDDIHIYDSVYSIYTGAPYTSPVVTQPALSGNSWVNFVTDGKIIASINPNGQNMGNTEVQAFIHTGTVRVDAGQYYHNRNITIKPANTTLPDSATIRFYFLDAETEVLLNATGCGGCGKPRSAYELGITKYSNTNDALENGTLSDNYSGGTHSFILPVNVKKVPFDKGYYAEFKVKDFSEFWLNNGGPGGNQALPVELIYFTATKNGENVLLDWKTGSESNSSHFELELARGDEEYRQNRFTRIGEIQSHGNSSVEQYYQFRDEETGKTGVRYYRLKMVDRDGRFTYSPVRAVLFEEEIRWQLYPNPTGGVFNLIFQAEQGETVHVKIYDSYGRVVRHLRLIANAFIQKSTIDLSSSAYASGVYMVEVTTSNQQRVFRVLKNQ